MPPTDLPTPLPLWQWDAPIVVVDVESTGLDIRTDYPVEVAWYNLSTGDRGEFVPHHDPMHAVHHAHPRALAVNGYRERVFYGAEHGAMDDDGAEAAKLWAQLTPKGARPYLAGANAAGHDQWMIAKLWPALAWTSDFPWSYRVLDLGNIGMTELGPKLLGGDNLPGLAKLREKLALDIPDPDHTAMGDVYTTTLILVELLRRRDIRLNIHRNADGYRLCHAPVTGLAGAGSALCALPIHGDDVAHQPPERATLQP